MSKSKLTTTKIKKITKATGNVIAIEYYENYLRAKHRYNSWIKQEPEIQNKEGLEVVLKHERLSAIENYNLAFCLN